jgi:hypothetical protein
MNHFDIFDHIIDLEDKYLKKYNNCPNFLVISYKNYVKLIKEIQANCFMNNFHGMTIKISTKDSIRLE